MGTRLLAVIGMGICLWAAGCTSRGGTVRMDSPDAGKVLTQTFNHAYIALAQPGPRDAALAKRVGEALPGQLQPGAYDIVLVDSALDWDYRETKANKPLQPATLAPLRQVMHIHLLWRPLIGTTKNPAAINATIDWYVLGQEGTSDLLVYEGAAYVIIETSGDTRDVEIRDGTLRLKLSRGNLSDPVAKATIQGELVAEYNASRVKDTLEQIEKIRAAVSQ